MTAVLKPSSSSSLIQIDRLPDLSVVVPTFNNVRYTIQFFASLARSVPVGVRYEVLVVDNGSTDETLSFVGTHTPGQLAGGAQGPNPPVAVHLLHNPKPRALARSWNMGVDAARGRHILVSNNDVIFHPGAIGALIDAAVSETQAGVVIALGPRDIHSGLLPAVTTPDTAAAIAANLQAVENWSIPRTTLEAGAARQMVTNPYLPQGGYCWLLTRRAWERVGRFDEAFELTGEDYDWFARCRRHFKIVLARGAYIEHYEHATCLHLADEYHERLCQGRFRLAEKHEHTSHFFSIILPVYNRVDALKAAIDSVLRQTFPHWRLFVIDDGSGEWDGISRLAKAYSHEAGRIWFFHRRENAGPAAARNYGLRLSAGAKGKYVAFLDSDDVWYPDHLRRHFEAHEAGNWAMIYSRPDFAWREWDPEARLFLHRPDTHPTISYFGPYDAPRLIRGNYIQTSSVTVWGDLARSLSFPENQRIEEDWEYFKAIADAGGAGRPVLHLPGSATCRYHIARRVHEEDHLMRRAGAVAADAGSIAPFSVRQLVVLPHVPSPEPAPINESSSSSLLSSIEETPEAQEGKAVAAPLLGLVIPTRNRHEDLERALISVGADTPACVVDDGSADAAGVRRVSAVYHAALLRMPPAHPGKGHGASAARNRGSLYLPATWLQFLDDDDTLVPDWRARLLPYLTDDWDVIIAQAWVPEASGKAGFVASGNEADDVFTSQLCVRRTALLACGGFLETCFWAEERELLTRLEAQGARILRIAVPLVVRARRGGSGDPSTRVGPPNVPNVPPARTGSGRSSSRVALPPGRRGF